MNTIPVILALVGLGVLILSILSWRYVRRELENGKLDTHWRRWRIFAFVIGGLLVLTIPWQQYPLGEGTALGVPFFASWYDAKGRDFVGPITLPALLGNLVFWLLSPHLVLAYFARKYLLDFDGSYEPNG